MFVTAQHQNNHSKKNEYCVQDEFGSVPSASIKSSGYSSKSILANDRPFARAVPTATLSSVRSGAKRSSIPELAACQCCGFRFFAPALGRDPAEVTRGCPVWVSVFCRRNSTKTL